jgi:aspartate aminotransferase
MHGLGSKRSVIRELFEFGKKRAAELGADKVFDFSLGNPNVPAPECVRASLKRLIDLPDSTTIHGYTSAQGDSEVRKAIAASINARFNANVSPDFIYMTCGAAASLCISLRALNELDDEFIIFAPYFPEYQVFIKAAGGVPVTVPFNPDDFQIDFGAFEKAVTKKTKAVIINSPNNPCGVVYPQAAVQRVAEILRRKSAEFGKPIVLISDEPYRELVYDGAQVPYVMNFYDDSIVCYSYSKSLSLPGERIGYIAISPEMRGKEGVYAAVCGAGRALGYVCAPSLFQRVVAQCADAKPDIAAYKRNRDLLYGSLTQIGYSCVYPDGAFYLFVKALEADANAFAGRAKDFGLLLVPGDDFAAAGYVRIAYCVNYDMIKRSLPSFKLLFDAYKAV